MKSIGGEAMNWTPKSIETWNQNFRTTNFNGNGAIRLSTEEFKQTEPKRNEIVSFEPPLAHKSTRSRLAKKIELPELLLLSILAPSTDHQPRGLKFSTRHGPNTQESRDS